MQIVYHVVSYAKICPGINSTPTGHYRLGRPLMAETCYRDVKCRI